MMLPDEQEHAKATEFEFIEGFAFGFHLAHTAIARPSDWLTKEYSEKSLEWKEGFENGFDHMRDLNSAGTVALQKDSCKFCGQMVQTMVKKGECPESEDGYHTPTGKDF
jgi:hypothetical protein